MQLGDTLSGNHVSGANNLFVSAATGDEEASAGQNLVMPQQINSKYQGGTALPYQRFMNTVVMSMYPQLKFNPPDNHHSFLGEVVHAIVDTAAELIGAALGFVLGGGPIGAGIGAAILTGLTDAAYQGVAVKEGWQEHFSLGEVGAEGIEAGIAAYILAPAGNFGLNAATSVATASATSATAASVPSLITAAIAQQTLLGIIRNAGEIAVLDQLTEMSLGQSDKFDFTGILTAMVTAAASYQLGDEVQGIMRVPGGLQEAGGMLNGLTDNVLQSLTGNIIQSGLYDTLTGQTMYMSQIAASALGSGAGQSLGNEVLAVIQNKVSPTNPNNRASGNASAAVDGSIDPSTGSNAANANGTAANGLTKPASDGGGGQGSSQSSGQAVPGSSSNNSGTSSNATSPANKYSSYSASQNPGRNANGLFSGASSTGSINSGLSSNNASQDYSSNGSRDSTYGSGNATPTAKSFQDIAIAFQIQDAGQLANTPINQLTPNITLPTNPYLDFASQISSQNNSQLSESIFMKAIGLYSRLDVINMLGLEDGLSFSVSNTNGLNSLEKFNYDFGRGVGLGLGIGSLLIPGGIEIDAARLSAVGNSLVNSVKSQIDITLNRALEPLDQFANSLGDLAESSNSQPVGTILNNIDNTQKAIQSSGYLAFSNRSTALTFYLQSGYGYDATSAYLRGIDFEQPVDVITLPEGTHVIQYSLPNRPIGNYFTIPGTPAAQLGIYTSGRNMNTFFATQDVSVLRSITSLMIDDYSMSQYGWQIETQGGGIQYFSPSTNIWSMRP